MILCLAIAYILQLKTSYPTLRKKSSSKSEEPEIILLSLCGVETIKFFKEFKIGVGVEVTIKLTIKDSSKPSFRKLSKSSPHLFLTFLLLRSMVLEIMGLTVEEISITGEFGLVVHLLKAMKLLLVLSTVSLEHKPFLFLRQSNSLLQIGRKDTNQTQCVFMKGMVANSALWQITWRCMLSQVKILKNKYISVDWFRHLV